MSRFCSGRPGSPPARSRALIPLLGAAVLCALALSGARPAAAQEKNDSPVFKKYRPPQEPPLVVQSDALYQMWETFIVTRKANAGDVLAQHELSLRYLLGRGAAPDTARAALWMKRASDQHYTPAMFNYAIICYNGWGVKWDPFEAYRLFRACAEKGMPEAGYAMAQFLTEDLVVPRNFDSAYAWVSIAGTGAAAGAGGVAGVASPAGAAGCSAVAVATLLVSCSGASTGDSTSATGFLRVYLRLLSGVALSFFSTAFAIFTPFRLSGKLMSLAEQSSI